MNFHSSALTYATYTVLYMMNTFCSNGDFQKFYSKEIFVLCYLPLTAHFSCRSRNRDKYGD